MALTAYLPILINKQHLNQPRRQTKNKKQTYLGLFLVFAQCLGLCHIPAELREDLGVLC